MYVVTRSHAFDNHMLILLINISDSSFYANFLVSHVTENYVDYIPNEIHINLSCRQRKG